MPTIKCLFASQKKLVRGSHPEHILTQKEFEEGDPEGAHFRTHSVDTLPSKAGRSSTAK